jgi:aminoglycoside 3-N-acetyltransferase
VGEVEGGVVTMVKAIKKVVSEDGAVLVPTFCAPTQDRVFNIRRTPSRVGLMTEAFRRTQGARRSRHPTHSVTGWGRKAMRLLEAHERTSALGADSPFHKAAKAGGYVLMIGCQLNTCSLIHVAEAVIRVPYLGRYTYRNYDDPITLIDYDGSAHRMEMFDMPADSKAFLKVQDLLEQRGLIHHGTFGNAEALRFSGADGLEAALELLRKDPTALLCEKATCPVCPPSRTCCAEYLAAGHPWPPDGWTRPGP